MDYFPAICHSVDAVIYAICIYYWGVLFCNMDFDHSVSACGQIEHKSYHAAIYTCIV